MTLPDTEDNMSSKLFRRILSTSVINLIYGSPNMLVFPAWKHKSQTYKDLRWTALKASLFRLSESTLPNAIQDDLHDMGLILPTIPPHHAQDILATMVSYVTEIDICQFLRGKACAEITLPINHISSLLSFILKETKNVSVLLGVPLLLLEFSIAPQKFAVPME